MPDGSDQTSDGAVPEETCTICGEPAVVSSRAPVSPDSVEVPDGELVPLCARHAEQANEPEVTGEG